MTVNNQRASQHQQLSAAINRLNAAHELVRQELLEVTRLSQLLANFTLSEDTADFPSVRLQRDLTGR